MQCPKCDSENVRLLSLIYEEGSYTEESTSQTTISGGGYVSAGGGGVYTGNQSGTTKTTTTGLSEAAKKAAPPAKATPFKDFLGLIVFSVVASGLGVIMLNWLTPLPGFLVNLMGLVALALLLRRAYGHFQADKAFNLDKYPELRARWERSWSCTKCGQVFEHGEAAAA